VKKLIITILIVSVGVHLAAGLVAGIVVVARYFTAPPAEFKAARDIRLPAKKREQKMNMAALDAAVIAPAIPALRAAFGVDNRQIGLVTIIFSLCSLTSTALMANLSDRFGRRSIYLMDIAGFAFGSLLIARSTTFGMLLLGRAIQGLSAGGITPTASSVVGDTFPPDQRGRVLGLIGATFGMAFLVGPVVASALLVWASWQWIFLINLPVAAIVFAMSWRALPRRTHIIEHPPFDYAGITVLDWSGARQFWKSGVGLPATAMASIALPDAAAEAQSICCQVRRALTTAAPRASGPQRAGGTPARACGRVRGRCGLSCVVKR
jgi:MFS family permease